MKELEQDFGSLDVGADSSRRDFIWALAGSTAALAFSSRRSEASSHSNAPSARASYPGSGTGIVDVTHYGAKGDGTTDDTDALIQAEEAAFQKNKALFFPEGIFPISGVFQTRVSVFGVEGSSSTSGTVIRTTNAGSHYYTFTVQDTNNVVVDGVTVDASHKTRGIHVQTTENVTIRNCKVYNALAVGIGLFYAHRSSVLNCYVEGIQYGNTPGSSAADGIHLGGSHYCLVQGNTIFDFERIGIVTESNGAGTFSANNLICNNRIEYGHDSLNAQSADHQGNAGIWCENSHTTIISQNIISDMGGNGKQSSLTAGIVVSFGALENTTFSIIDNDIDVGGGSVETGRGISLGGPNASYASYETRKFFINCHVSRNRISHCTQGVSVFGAFSDVRISENIFENIEPSAVENILNLLPYEIKTLEIVANKKKNCVPSSNPIYADIHLRRVDVTMDRFVLKDLEDWSYINSASNNLNVKSIIVEGSRIKLRHGDGQTSGFRAERIQISNCTFQGIDTVTKNLFAGFAPGSINVLVSNTVFDHIRTELYGDATVVIQFDNCIFEKGSFVKTNFLPGAAVDIKFQNCRFLEYDTDGVIQTNYSYPNEVRLTVQGCQFVQTGVVPIQKFGSVTPKQSYICMNRGSVPQLTNFMSAVTQYELNVYTL